MKKWSLCEPENWHYAASVFPLRKLAKLKVKLAKIVETLPIDAAKQVKQLLGVKKDIKEVSKFEALFYRLNALAPSYSDGTEHVTIQLLEEVCSHPEDAGLNSADGVFLKGIGVLLERISKEFADYAKRIKQC